MLERSQKEDVLYYIPTSRWVVGAVERILVTGSDDRATWNRCWQDQYRVLGGKNSSGEKPCPCGAAYGLWFLGRLKVGQRPLLKLSVKEIYKIKSLGKNAAYAVIAADLLDKDPYQSDSELWFRVKSEFRWVTGMVPAQSDQGEVKLVSHIFRSGGLVSLQLV